MRFSAVCLGSIFLLHGFLIPLSYHYVSFSLAPPYFGLAISCLFRYFLPWLSSPRCFGAFLPSVLSPQFAWAVLSFSCCVGFVGSPSLSTLSHSVCGSPSSFYPSCSSLHFYSFSTLLTWPNLRFPPRRDPPFGPSQFHIRFFLFRVLFWLLVLRASLRRSPSAPLLLLVPLVLFRVILLFFSHLLLLFRGMLVWDS